MSAPTYTKTRTATKTAPELICPALMRADASRCLPMNSRPPSSFSTAYLTSSSVACLPVCSPRSWDTAAIGILAELLGLDPHTVVRGHRQLLNQNVTTGRCGQFANIQSEAIALLLRALALAALEILGLRQSRIT